MTGQGFDDAESASEFDSERHTVAERLAPIADASVPDLWARLEADSPSAVVGLEERATPTRWLAPALAAACVVALLVAATLLAPRQGQEIQSPADEAVEPEEADDVSQDQPNTTQAKPTPSFPDDLEIGPDRTAMSSIPFGDFALHYEAGIVVVDPDGAVRGHYPQPDPEFLVEVERPNTSDPVPEDCVLDGFAPEGTTQMFCRGQSGPTVEVVDEQGQRHIIASFPQPPESLPEQATVFGTIVAAFPSPVPWRPAPVLLQMNAECESRLAVMTNGETIRHIDGTDYWDDSWPAGQSVALGWNPEGTEAYVWRTTGGCDQGLEEPGVYAFGVDGNSRLLFPTDDRVSDVALITGRRFPATGSDTATLQRSEAWRQWAGELRYESTRSEEFDADSTFVVRPRTHQSIRGQAVGHQGLRLRHYRHRAGRLDHDRSRCEHQTGAQHLHHRRRPHGR